MYKITIEKNGEQYEFNAEQILLLTDDTFALFDASLPFLSYAALRIQTEALENVRKAREE